MRVGRLPASGSNRRNRTKPNRRMSATAVRMRKTVCTVPEARGRSSASSATAAAWPAMPRTKSHSVLRKVKRSCGRTRSSAPVATRAVSASQARAVSSALSISEPDPARQHVLPHRPVPGEAEQRVGEGRRAVLLEKEVPDPGERVARGEAPQEPPEIEGGEGVQRRGEAERGADEVQPPARPVRVLGEVAGIKLGKAHFRTRPTHFSRHFSPVEVRTTGTLTRLEPGAKRIVSHGPENPHRRRP